MSFNFDLLLGIQRNMLFPPFRSVILKNFEPILDKLVN